MLFRSKSELLQNIALLKSRLFGEDVEKIKLFSNVKIHLVSFIKSAPLLLIQLLFLSLWLFLFLCLRFLYTKHYKFLITTLFVLIALSGIVLAIKYTYVARKYGVVVAKQSKLLSGPAESFQVLGVLPEAKEVLIKKDSDGFYKIKVNGQIGWASSGEVEAI